MDGPWPVVSGMIFYAICIAVLGSPTTPSRSKAQVVLCTCTPALLTSAWLAYILATEIRTLCLVCAASYAINTGLFFSALAGLRAGSPTGDKKQR